MIMDTEIPFSITSAAYYRMINYDFPSPPPLAAEVDAALKSEIGRFVAEQQKRLWLAQSTETEKPAPSMSAIDANSSAQDLVDTSMGLYIHPLIQLCGQLERLEAKSAGEWHVLGERPTDTAFAAAKLFIGKLPPNVLTPEIGLPGDGEINLHWRTAVGSVLDVGIFADGSFTYFVKTPDGNTEALEGGPAAKGLPARLLAILAS